MHQENNQTIESTLITVTRELLIESGESPEKEVRLDASFSRHLGIDSLSRAELFARIMQTTKIDLPDRLLAEAECLQDIIDYVKARPGDYTGVLKDEVVRSHGKRPEVSLSDTQTLVGVLLEYGEKAPEKAHIYFQNEDGGEDIITYGDLLQNSLKVAAGLKQLGLYDGETVAIMLPSHPRFFYTFFGTLLAGGVPVPIYPPYRMHMLESYAKTEAKILRNAEVRILVTFDQAEKLSLMIQSFVPSLKHVTTAEALLKNQPLKAISATKQDDHAFIQYTSGSTGTPKGVLLTHYNLLSNVRAYGKAIGVKPDDVAVSWLPLYHDLGLIGMWLGSLYHGIPLVLMTPFSFLNRPERWLWAMHRHRGTLSGAPNFAYELCIKKIKPEMIEGLDLSHWRMAANGAEKVYPSTLERFAEKFAPYGFRRDALYPVYGLAESTVGLVLPPPGREFKVDHVEREAFEQQKKAVHTAQENALAFVSCGKAIPGHEVRIVDDQDNVLPERSVGHLHFKGPSNMQGYYHNPKATQAVFHDGWIDSGDLAYQAEGEIYITGRSKDLIVKAGRNLYPAELEEIAGKVEGVREGCVAVFGSATNGRATEKVVVVAETKETDQVRRSAIRTAIKAALMDSLEVMPDEVVLVKPHTVPKTSSGKLQRAACKQLFEDKKLSKQQTPAWLQVVKLFCSSAFQKIKSVLAITAKSIYTIYSLLVLGIWMIPAFIVVGLASRDTSAKFIRYWARSVLLAVFCPFKVVHSQKLDENKAMIYAVNHASYVDSIVTMAVMPPKTLMIGKQELFSSPITAYFMSRLGYIGIERFDLAKGMSDTEIIKQKLAQGYSVLIFPEGTFSYAGGLRPFRLGAFKISVDTGVPIQPVSLKGTRKIMRGNERLMRPSWIQVTVSDPIKPKDSQWAEVMRMRDVVKAEISKHCGEPVLDYLTTQHTDKAE